MKNGQKFVMYVNGKAISETEATKTPIEFETEKQSKDWRKYVSKEKEHAMSFGALINKLPNQ